MVNGKLYCKTRKSFLTFYVQRKKVAAKARSAVCESGCNFWFHRVCTGLQEFAFHQLTQEVYAEWVCDTCFKTKDVPLVKFKP